MHERPQLFRDITRQLDDAARARQQLEAERWRETLRPRAMRIFAARTAKLPCSRALLKLVVEELYPDDLFRQLVGNLDRVPRARWPQAIAMAVALRHSWHRDGLTRIAKRLHVSLKTDGAHHTQHTNDHHRPSRRRVFGSPQSCQGFPLRSNPVRGWRP